jgi:hypothetical protein
MNVKLPRSHMSSRCGASLCVGCCLCDMVLRPHEVHGPFYLLPALPLRLKVLMELKMSNVFLLLMKRVVLQLDITVSVNHSPLFFKVELIASNSSV